MYKNRKVVVRKVSVPVEIQLAKGVSKRVHLAVGYFAIVRTLGETIPALGGAAKKKTLSLLREQGTF